MSDMTDLFWRLHPDAVGWSDECINDAIKSLAGRVWMEGIHAINEQLDIMGGDKDDVM